MKEKKAGRLLIITIIALTIVIAFILLKLIDGLLLGIGVQAIGNKVGTIFSLIIFSYSIVIQWNKSIQKMIERVYVKSNEKGMKTIDYQYYRDIIQNYSIGTMIKCYGEKVSPQDQLVAMLLKLKMDKKIKLNNGNIEVIEEEGLSPSETIFIKACKGYKIYKKEYLAIQLEEDNEKDAMQSDLFSKKIASSFGFNQISWGTGIIWILDFITIIILPKILYLDNYIAFVLAIIAQIFLTISMIGVAKKKIFYRTPKGVEVKNKLIGLKNFSTDFSNMNKKTIKEINIWEDYLIYAILFNIRGKLDSEAYEIYEEYIEKFC